MYTSGSACDATFFVYFYNAFLLRNTIKHLLVFSILLAALLQNFRLKHPNFRWSFCLIPIPSHQPHIHVVYRTCMPYLWVRKLLHSCCMSGGEARVQFIRSTWRPYKIWRRLAYNYRWPFEALAHFVLFRFQTCDGFTFDRILLSTQQAGFLSHRPIYSTLVCGYIRARSKLFHVFSTLWICALWKR